MPNKSEIFSIAFISCPKQPSCLIAVTFTLTIKFLLLFDENMKFSSCMSWFMINSWPSLELSWHSQLIALLKYFNSSYKVRKMFSRFRGNMCGLLLHPTSNGRSCYCYMTCWNNSVNFLLWNYYAFVLTRGKYFLFILLRLL
jgi:hypothetical protein